MSEFDGVRLVALVGWLILAASAFASYRLDWEKGLRLALVWIAIFTGAALLFGLLLP